MARRAILIGLTGTLGAGKSTALSELALLGASTASADQAAHDLSGPGGSVSRAVARLFGARYLRADGSVDRRAVARRVFDDPRARRRLEKATHPLIMREVRRRLSHGRGRGRSPLAPSRALHPRMGDGFARRRRRAGRAPVAVVDAPLLFEAGLAREFDVTVAVTAPKAAALSRVRARGGLTRGQALARMRAQWSAARKEAAADVAWRNSGSKTDFLKQVRRYYRAWELIARTAPTRYR